ncbi:MAG: GDP-mannose 4,6-dehydratase, partial [Woeseiaceae bacterium]
TWQAPFSEKDPPGPVEPYAISKMMAEKVLWDIAGNSRMDVTVIRPPLVYGPFVKGNFLRLLKLVDTGLPLPFGGIDNRRSYVGLQNLCGLIATCVVHESAPGQLFLVADGEDIATPALLRTLKQGLGRKNWIPSCPLGPLQVLASWAGKSAEMEKLIASLQIDASKARTQLGWSPEVSLRRGISQMVEWFAASAQRYR